MTELSAEDDKLSTLARAARSRIMALEGAAVRDETGRTYASANVISNNLTLTAVELAVGQAIAAGAQSIEALVVCQDGDLTSRDREVIAGFAGNGIPVYVVSLSGDVQSTTLT